MDGAFSVHDVIDQLSTLHGGSVLVHGLLAFEFEHMALWHYPKNERREIADTDELPYYRSSIWLHFGDGSVRPSMEVLTRWDGKRVAVLGKVFAPRYPLGCGHFSGWGCEIEPVSIQCI